MNIRTRISTCCTLTHNWTRIITFSEKARKKKVFKAGNKSFFA